MGVKLLCIGVLLNINLIRCSNEKILGYGTKFGTILDEDSKKVIGLGAPEGFLSSDNEEAILEVFHRYKEHQRLVEEAKTGTDGLECKDGCPEGSHCSGGVCFCNADIATENLEVGSATNSTEGQDSSGSNQETQLVEGVCKHRIGNRTFSPKVTTTNSGDLHNCSVTSDCWAYDINFLCIESQCVCRDSMKFDKYASECRIYLDVDCSSYLQNSPVAETLSRVIDEIMDGNDTTENEIIPESLLAFLDPISTGLFSKEEIDEAFCRDVHYLGQFFDDREDDATIALLAVVLGVVTVLVLLVLACVALSGCVCWCCFDSCRQKLENIFSSNSYSKDLEGKANDFSEKDEVDGGDKLEKVMSGYQPVPQHPPPGYPQGSASLPRGCSLPSKTTSLPRGATSKTNSLARGVSPIPRAYPQLAEAPPGYPESPQKTGPPPLGYPQSPPEYPQTPTPPGFPSSKDAKTKPLYPQIPEK